ncbi:MAG: cadherin-like beta sandwich domain-containing protein [Acidobacteriia bacterium]|nr:cadherin-like beta sandwich domain-containing protein [Terriglobia bacterium]
MLGAKISQRILFSAAVVAVVCAGQTPAPAVAEAPRADSTVRKAAGATSTRYKGLTVNGVEVKSGLPAPARLTAARREMTIVVTSPDGSASTKYTIAAASK